jgi:hypothetical protein
MRARLGLWFVGAGTYLVYCSLLAVQVHWGYATPAAALPFLAALLIGNGGIYAAIRSGRAARWTLDPDLAKTDLLFGMVLFWWGYLITGPAAIGQIIVMATHIVYAVFSMSPAQVRGLAVLSLAGLATVMGIGNALDPVRYPAGPQWLAFGYTALVVP